MVPIQTLSIVPVQTIPLELHINWIFWWVARTFKASATPTMECCEMPTPPINLGNGLQDDIEICDLPSPHQSSEIWSLRAALWRSCCQLAAASRQESSSNLFQLPTVDFCRHTLGDGFNAHLLHGYRYDFCAVQALRPRALDRVDGLA